MACASQAMLSANRFTSPNFLNQRLTAQKGRSISFATVRASTEEDCNEEECAPDKEIGSVSGDWLAKEKTGVVGTFPPRTRGWTGYVEKDTAGQENIYAVEPSIYVAESAISSGTAGSSSAGAENTAAITAGLALISIAAASSILLQVGKNQPPQVQTTEYSGPSLSYYINKFEPSEVIETAAPSVTESPSSLEPESSGPEVSEIQVQVEIEPEPATSS